MKISTYLKHVNFVTVFLLNIVVACDSNENKQRVTVDGHVILTQYRVMTAPKYLSLFFILKSKGQKLCYWTGLDLRSAVKTRRLERENLRFRNDLNLSAKQFAGQKELKQITWR